MYIGNLLLTWYLNYRYNYCSHYKKGFIVVMKKNTKVKKKKMALLKNLLLLIVLMLSSSSISVVLSLTLFDWQILITNTSKNQTLTTHCATNGEDIGTMALQPFAKQAFLDHVLVKQRSLASCDMSLGNKRGRFDVFDSDRGDLKRCADKTCVWNVNEDGLFLDINNQYLLQYQWP